MSCKQKQRREENGQVISDKYRYLQGGRTMKKVIDEIKKHKKAMIGVAVIVVVFAWILITNEPAPVEAQ